MDAAPVMSTDASTLDVILCSKNEKKPSLSRWTGTPSMILYYAISVALICNAIIMANCVVRVEPFSL